MYWPRGGLAARVAAGWPSPFEPLSPNFSLLRCAMEQNAPWRVVALRTYTVVIRHVDFMFAVAVAAPICLSVTAIMSST